MTEIIEDLQRERLTTFRNCFITSPSLDANLKLIHRCRKISKCGGGSECMILTGGPGAGKTSVKKKYKKLYPGREESERTFIPVFLSEFPPKTSPREAAVTMAMDLGHELSPKGMLDIQLTKQLVKLIKGCGVEVILLDEFHNLIETRSYEVLEEAVRWLKFLVNALEDIPIVLFGLPYSKVILNCDDQLNRRFMIRRMIEPFRILKKEDREIYRIFLKRISLNLPFEKKVALEKEEFSLRLSAFSKGNIGRLKNILDFAVEEAIENDDNELTLEHLSAAFDFYMQCGDDNLDEIDVTEKLKDQPNPFQGNLQNLYFKQMLSPSSWNMKADPGESPIIAATYTNPIPLRVFLRRK